MKAIGFQKVKVLNPTTNVEVEKLRVSFDNGKSITLLTDLTVEQIKADRDKLLSKVVVCEGEFGQYCLFTKAELLEAF